MAYDTEELKAKSLEVAKKFNCIFLQDIIDHIGVSKQTFYSHKLDEFDDLKEIINRNRFNLKNTLRRKWAESDNATTQIVLYKLCATDEEIKLLNPAQRNETLNVNVQTSDTMTKEQLELEVQKAREVLS